MCNRFAYENVTNGIICPENGEIRQDGEIEQDDWTSWKAIFNFDENAECASQFQIWRFIFFILSTIL